MKKFLVVLTLLFPAVAWAGGQAGGRLEEHFRRMDRDGDGRLTAGEVRRPEIIERADADGDGAVTLEELRESMASRMRERARPDALPPTHADVSYGPHERNVLDLYPADSEEPTPLLIYIHGGGFVGGDKRSVSPGLIRAMHANGISVAAIHYRFITSNPMPAPFHDGARAVQWLRHNAERYNLDPEKFAATGGSAGAGISLWLAFHDDLADPKAKDPVLRQSTRLTCAQVGGAQVSYDPRFWREIGLTRGLEHRSFPLMYGEREEGPPSPELIALFEECAPIEHATADDPPVYLVYNVGKQVTPDTPMGAIIHHPLHGLTLQEKLEPLGVECTVVYRDGPEPPMSPIEFLVRNLTGREEVELPEGRRPPRRPARGDRPRRPRRRDEAPESD